MTQRIDLNSDLGEECGDDEAMLSLVSSANIACGGHAGDSETMFQTLTLAAHNGVVVGGPSRLSRPAGLRPAHHPDEQPGDREDGGGPDRRPSWRSPPSFPSRSATSRPTARSATSPPVTPVSQRPSSKRCSPSIRAWRCWRSREPRWSGSPGRPAWRPIPRCSPIAGTSRTASSCPEDEPGAMLHDPGEATDRAPRVPRQWADAGRRGEPIPLAADSICVHGDSDIAVAMTRRLRHELVAAGIRPTGFAASGG